MKLSHDDVTVELTFDKDRLVPGNSTEVTVSITAGQQECLIEELTVSVSPQAHTKHGISTVAEGRQTLATDLTMGRGEYRSLGTVVDIRDGVPGTLGPVDVFVTLEVTIDSEMSSIRTRVDIPVSPHEKSVIQSTVGDGIKLTDVDRVATHDTTSPTYFHLYEFGYDPLSQEANRVTVVVCADPRHPVAWTVEGRAPVDELDVRVDRGTRLHSRSEIKDVARQATKLLSY